LALGLTAGLVLAEVAALVLGVVLVLAAGREAALVFLVLVVFFDAILDFFIGLVLLFVLSEEGAEELFARGDAS
jgi:hypothetical protein